jgi:hypothetical protein
LGEAPRNSEKLASGGAERVTHWGQVYAWSISWSQRSLDKIHRFVEVGGRPSRRTRQCRLVALRLLVAHKWAFFAPGVGSIFGSVAKLVLRSGLLW